MIKLKPYQQALILSAVFAFLLVSLMATTNAFQESDYPILQNLAHIKNTGSVRVHDNSFGGHNIYRIQFFEIISYLLSLVLPLIAVKGIMIIVFSVSIYLVYIISFKITESPFASVFATIFAGTSTAFISSAAGFNDYLIAIPLILSLAYLIIAKNYNINWIMLLFIPLTLLNLSSLYFLLALVISYFIYINYGKKPNNVISELMIIFASVIMVVIMIFFYKALSLNGISIFYNNVPGEIVKGMLSVSSIISAALNIGPLLLLLAIGGLFIAYFNKLSRSYIIISLFAVSMLASILGSNQFLFVLFTFTGAILSAHSINYLFQFVSLSKISRYRQVIAVAFAIIVVVSSMLLSVPYIFSSSLRPPTQDMREAYSYLSNTSANQLYLVNLSYAGQAEYYTGHDAFIDNDFSGIKNSGLYYHDYKELFDAKSTVEALRIASKNNVGYILIGPNDKFPFYLTKSAIDTSCFRKKEFGDVSVYSILCGVK